MKKIEGFPYSITPCGKVYSHYSNRFLKNSKNNSGYYTCKLYLEGKVSYFLVHRLVASNYIPNPDKKPCVNHIDGNKENNSADNLEWSTYGENNEHSLKVLRNKKPLEYSDTFVHLIFKMIMDGQRKKDICSTLDITDGAYRSIVYDDFYSHIKEEYDFDNHPRKAVQITTDKVVKICEMLEKKMPYKEISEITGVSSGSIGQIKRRKIYRMLSESFKF